MATHTLITASAKTLTAITYSKQQTTLLPADLATCDQAIKTDLNGGLPAVYGSFCREGLLYIPRRGVLEVKTGDVIAWDNNGWPILLSAATIADATDWTYT